MTLFVKTHLLLVNIHGHKTPINIHGKRIGHYKVAFLKGEFDTEAMLSSCASNLGIGFSRTHSRITYATQFNGIRPYAASVKTNKFQHPLASQKIQAKRFNDMSGQENFKFGLRLSNVQVT